MAVTIRLKRRATGGAAGAPASLKSTEPAYNEVDDTVYLGFGDDGNGNATSIKAVAGAGTFATKQYVTDAMAGAGAGDMLAAVYDPDGKAADAFDVDNHVDGTTNKVFTATEKAKLSGIEASADVTDAANVGAAVHGVAAKATPVDADTVALIDSAASNVLKKLSWSNIKATLKTYFDTLYSASGHTHTKADVGLGNVDNTSDAGKPVSTATQTALNAKAPLASPTLTGTPTAPTATAGTNTTQIATTAYVRAEVAALVASAPGALDTLDELAAALGDDPNFATSVSTAIGEKLAKASNLSDLANAATARTNLGLGTMATQSAGAVAITGGSISGVVIDGGTF